MYAAENGNIAALKKFKASHDVGESTVRSFTKKYLQAKEKTDSRYLVVVKLLAKKPGRKLMLGEELDKKVKKLYLLLVLQLVQVWQ